MQRRAHRLAEAELGQLQHAVDAGNGLQTPMIAAVAAFTIGIDLGMTNLYQAAAAGVQQTAIGNHPGPHVVVDHHLNHVPRPA
ncbi:hypothetical protein D3C76_1335720 [compost metagenome]